VYKLDASDNTVPSLSQVGSLSGRLQVTNTSSGITNSKTRIADYASVEEPKKREITMISVEQNPTIQKRQKVLEHQSGAASKQVSKITEEQKIINKTTLSKALPSYASSQLTAESLQSSLVLLHGVPIKVAPKDIAATLFSGLSIAAMYICPISSVGQREDYRKMEKVNVFVQFHFIGAAELAMQRKGEEISYKDSEPYPQQHSVDGSTIGGADTGFTFLSSSGDGGSNTSSGVSGGRKQVRVLLSAVSAKVAAVVKSTAWKIVHSNSSSSSISSSSSTGGCSPSSALWKHIENAIPCISQGNCDSAERNMHWLSPYDWLTHWDSLMTHFLRPDGSIQSSSFEQSHHAVIKSDPNGLFRDSAVESVMFGISSGFALYGDDTEDEYDTNNNSKQGCVEPGEQKSDTESKALLCETHMSRPSSSSGSQKDMVVPDTLYNFKEDAQRSRYEHYYKEAEAAAQELRRRRTYLLSTLPPEAAVAVAAALHSSDGSRIHRAANAAGRLKSGKGDPVMQTSGVNYQRALVVQAAVDFLTRKLRWYEVMVKQLWSLSNTFCKINV
jgi:hypothetical protein